MPTIEQQNEPEQHRMMGWMCRGIGYAAFVGAAVTLVHDVYRIGTTSMPFSKETLINAGITATELLMGNRLLAQAKQFNYDVSDLEIPVAIDNRGEL